MKLLTQKLREQLPLLYSTEHNPDPTVICKFFTPDAGWTWYGLEFDGTDIFFGLVQGLEEELGYFSLAELEGIRGPFGLAVERDLYFSPTPLSQVQKAG